MMIPGLNLLCPHPAGDIVFLGADGIGVDRIAVAANWAWPSHFCTSLSGS